MSIFKFVTQSELDDLPEDPQLAFAALVNHAQRRYSEILGRLDPEENRDWREIEDTRHSFMNVVVAAGKRFEIAPFTDIDVPKLRDFNESDHRQFQADLDHYLTQLMLDNSIRNKKDSVLILPQSKDRIRSYVSGLRDCLEKANMDEGKRSALLKKLDEFEKELEKRRLSLMALTQMILTVVALPGGAWASVELANKLVTNILHVVAEAKESDEANSKISSGEQPKALSAPRKEYPSEGFPTHDDLDDDIPF